MLEIVLSRLKTQINTHCAKFLQNQWFFTLSPNTGGFAYSPHKCGGFLELTPPWETLPPQPLALGEDWNRDREFVARIPNPISILLVQVVLML
jgi:hypothetical protein